MSNHVSKSAANPIAKEPLNSNVPVINNPLNVNSSRVLPNLGDHMQSPQTVCLTSWAMGTEDHYLNHQMNEDTFSKFQELNEGSLLRVHADPPIVENVAPPIDDHAEPPIDDNVEPLVEDNLDPTIDDNVFQPITKDDKLFSVRAAFAMDIKAFNVATISGGSSSTSGNFIRLQHTSHFY